MHTPPRFPTCSTSLLVAPPALSRSRFTASIIALALAVALLLVSAVCVEAQNEPTITTPPNGSQFELIFGTPVTFTWTALPGVSQYGFEFTGTNLQFLNPNAPDPVNGFGGAGGGFVVAGTGFTTFLGPSMPPGIYQIRVTGLSATGQVIGTTSDPITIVLRPPLAGPPPNITSPASGTTFQAGSPFACAWTSVSGAVRYLFEFTGVNRSFINPGGVTTDPVNGSGGAGGALAVTGTSLTTVLPVSLVQGAYQFRVIGQSGTGQLIGQFSSAVTINVVPQPPMGLSTELSAERRMSADVLSLLRDRPGMREFVYQPKPDLSSAARLRVQRMT